MGAASVQPARSSSNGFTCSETVVTAHSVSRSCGGSRGRRGNGRFGGVTRFD